MPESARILTNAQRRAVLVARFEEKLREVWPDGGPDGGPDESGVPFADFNELESAATTLGDETMRRVMESALESALDLPAADRPERCDDCGRKLQYSRKMKTTATIRGPVTAERDYAYCRACSRGFFPLRGRLPSSRGGAERPVAQGLRRGRLELRVPSGR